MKTKLAIVIGVIFSAAVSAETSEIGELKQRVDELEKRQHAEEQEKGGITLGGAARFQYSYENYSDDNSDRGGTSILICSGWTPMARLGI